MTDRELLELAAFAAGIELHVWGSKGQENFAAMNLIGHPRWNPLTDDGDALRLAVSLGLVVDCSRPSAGEPFKLHHFGQEDFKDINAATRRAIVRAAAEIGRSMKATKE